MSMVSTLQVPLKFEGKAAKWNMEDLPSSLAPLLAHGYSISMETGRIGPTVRASGFDTPWIYVKGIDCKNCNIDHNIKHKFFNYIPPRCLQCWKVVVRPQTYKQLHKLLEVESGMDVPCKCGIEVRQYTPANYGGYFYNRSLDEGRERYEQVRKAVDDHLGKDVPVLLKRGCTEYEAGTGPSPFWVMPDKFRELDELLDNYIDSQPVMNGRQSEVQRAHVKKKWMVWAHNCGDMTYLDDNDGQQIVDPPVTYHEGDIDGIKDELAMAEAFTMAKSDGGVANTDALGQYREIAKKFQRDTGIDFSAMAQATAYLNRNYKGFPVETIDDSDQTA